jgi:COMPASS component SWD3
MNLNELYSYKYHLFGINQIKWNNDGSLLASGGNDCQINVIDIETMKVNRNFRADSVVTCLQFNYASNLILCGTFDNQIVLWDMRSKTMVYQLLSHSEPITSVNFSPDSSVLVSSSYDGFW